MARRNLRNMRDMTRMDDLGGDMPAQRALRRATVWMLLLSIVLLAGCNTLAGGQASGDLNGVRAALPSPTVSPSAAPGSESASEVRRQFLIRYTVDQMMK